jgi:hypothetical protein
MICLVCQILSLRLTFDIIWPSRSVHSTEAVHEPRLLFNMIPELSQKQLVDVAGKRTTNNLGTNEGDRTNSNPDAEKRL